MTEKEKAWELVNKFWNTDKTKHRSDAVKDALICVDEQINTLDLLIDDIYPPEVHRLKQKIDYCKNVKLEIQKL